MSRTVIERREPVNTYPQTFRLEVGWLGDQLTCPSSLSIEEDAELLTRSLALRLSHHPTSTYVLVAGQWSSTTCRRVLGALLRDRTLFAEHQDTEGCIVVRLRTTSDVVVGQPIDPSITRPDGLAELLAESAQSVLQEFAAVCSKRQPPAHVVREKQGLLFE